MEFGVPRYFFHTMNGHVELDCEGTELPDFQTARTQAVLFAGELLQEDPINEFDLRVEVVDEQGSLLFTFIAQAINAEAPLPEFRV